MNEEDSDTEITSLPKTRSVTRAQQTGAEELSPKKRVKSSAVDLSGLASAETSDADELVTRPTSRKRRAAEPSANFVVDDDSDDSDDVVVSSPAKRRRRENVSEEPRTPRKTSEQDRLDLEEDLRDFEDSGTIDFAKLYWIGMLTPISSRHHNSHPRPLCGFYQSKETKTLGDTTP